MKIIEHKKGGIFGLIGLVVVIILVLVLVFGYF